MLSLADAYEVFSGNEIGNGTFSRFLGAAAAVTGGFYRGRAGFRGLPLAGVKYLPVSLFPCSNELPSTLDFVLAATIF